MKITSLTLPLFGWIISLWCNDIGAMQSNPRCNFMFQRRKTNVSVHPLKEYKVRCYIVYNNNANVRDCKRRRDGWSMEIYFNNRRLNETNERYKITNNKRPGRLTLKIRRFTKYDVGIYKCVHKVNGNVERTQTYNLTLPIRDCTPHFTDKWEGTVKVIQSFTTILFNGYVYQEPSCTGKSHYSHFWKFYLNGNLIDPATNKKYAMTTKGLIIFYSDFSDEGTYECRIGNESRSLSFEINGGVGERHRFTTFGIEDMLPFENVTEDEIYFLPYMDFQGIIKLMRKDVTQELPVYYYRGNKAYHRIDWFLNRNRSTFPKRGMKLTRFTRWNLDFKYKIIPCPWTVPGKCVRAWVEIFKPTLIDTGLYTFALKLEDNPLREITTYFGAYLMMKRNKDSEEETGVMFRPVNRPIRRNLDGKVNLTDADVDQDPLQLRVKIISPDDAKPAVNDTERE